MEKAEVSLALSTERNIGTWTALNTVLTGWALAETGALAEGARQIRRAIDQFNAMGLRIVQLRMAPYAADVLSRTGAHDEALAVLGEASKVMEKTDARCLEAEIYRIRGAVLLRKSKEFHEDAVSDFKMAMKVASHQNAMSYQLLAAMELARVLGDSGRDDEGYALLATIYARFTEGFETAYLRKAKRLLDHLS